MKMIDFQRFAAAARRFGSLLGIRGPMGAARQAPRRPVGSALRNPKDSHQAQRIREAEAKRARRAARRLELHDRSIRNNPCLAH